MLIYEAHGQGMVYQGAEVEGGNGEWGNLPEDLLQFHSRNWPPPLPTNSNCLRGRGAGDGLVEDNSPVPVSGLLQLKLEWSEDSGLGYESERLDKGGVTEHEQRAVG